MEKPGVPVTGMGVLIGLLPPGQVLFQRYSNLINPIFVGVFVLTASHVICSLQTNYQTAAPPYTFKDKMINKSIIYMWVLTR